MPELPEVQTIVQQLKNKVIGKTIIKALVLRDSTIAYPDVDNFCSEIKNKTIEDISRRGKFIKISLSENYTLVAHMRMTGRLYEMPEDFPDEKHLRVKFILNDDKTLRFVDPRPFGRIWLAKNDIIDSISGIDKLGLEPFNENLTLEYLKDSFKNKKKPIKNILLEQNIVTGIGNIYADEILNDAKINPMKLASELNKEDLKRLADSIPRIIKINLDECLNNIDDQLSNLLGYQKSSTIKVYKHDGKQCPNCDSIIEKTKISSRSSYFCPNCQKLT